MDEEVDIQKVLEENRKLKEELEKSNKKKNKKEKVFRKEKRKRKAEKVSGQKKKISKKLLISIIIFIILIITGVVTFVFIYNSFNIEKFKKNIVLIQGYNDDVLVSVGSGVYIDEKTIYTNAHVIEDADKIEIVLDNNSKVKLKGIQAIDKKKDIAILVTEKVKDVKKLKIAKKVKTGTEVYAVGSPLGIKNTVSDGVISTKTKDKDMKVTIYQHTAPISSGSSGGALINKRGELIGINYASYVDGQNLNLAIKISEFDKVYEKTKNDKLIKKATSSFFKINELMNTAGKEVIREICSINATCYAVVDENGFYESFDDYKTMKRKIEKVIIIEALRAYDKTYDGDEWLRVYLFKMKNRKDKFDDDFKGLVDSMALNTRDTYYYLDFNHYWAINNNYYYYIEYSDNLNISNIVENLRNLTGGEYE